MNLRIRLYRDAFSKIPGIDEMAGTINNIGFSYSRIPLEAKGVKKESMFMRTGENYIDVMKLKLVAGQGLSGRSKGDIGKSIIINEKLAFQFGWKPEEAIGKQISYGDTTTCTVIGVLKDFTPEHTF